MRRPKHTTAEPLVVGIDLGGTNLQIGVVDRRDRILGTVRCKTRAREGYRKTIDRIAEGVKAACIEADVSLRSIRAVGIAAPGAVDIPRGIVLEAPNLKWKNVPLREELARRLRLPVVLDNDVNGAVWGEFQLGAGAMQMRRSPIQNPKSKIQNRSILGVWLGTGVGGGLVLDGRLYHGPLFTAGEVGQTVLYPDGPRGRRTVEDFCSRTGISRTIRLRRREFPKSALRKALQGGRGVVDSQVLADAFRRRNALAVAVVNDAARLLGIAIANWVTVLALDLIIIGGGVTETLGAPFLKEVRESFDRDVFPKRNRRAKLVMTRLRDDAGLLGAALLARETLSNPSPNRSFTTTASRTSSPRSRKSRRGMAIAGFPRSRE